MWPINASLTQDILETDFFEAVERAEKKRFYPKLAIDKTVKEITTTFPSFGSVPEIRQLSNISGGGVRQPVALKDWAVSGTVAEWEQTIPWRRIVAESNPEAVRAKTAQTAQKAMKGLDRLFCQALVASTAGYDGVSLINDAHPESGANQDNNLTAVALTTDFVPTGAEAESMLLAATGALKSFVDDQGTPVNEGVDRFIVLCPPPMELPFVRIADPNMSNQAVDSSGATGVFRGRIEVISSAYATTTGLPSGAKSNMWVFCADAMENALARIVLSDFQFNTNIGDDSSDDWNNGWGFTRSWAALAFIPWQWASVVLQPGS